MTARYFQSGRDSIGLHLQREIKIQNWKIENLVAAGFCGISDISPFIKINCFLIDFLDPPSDRFRLGT